RGRADLQSEIRFAQGEMWEHAGDRSRAWDCYQDVIGRFANDGPFAVDAVLRCAELLAAGDKKDQVLPMLAGVWARMTKPQQMAPEFRAQSNWFRIGRLYAARLADTGDQRRAAEVSSALGITAP